MEKLSLQKCCSLIIANRQEKALNYAVNYARHCEHLTEKTQEAKTQCLYILNNITHWRGDIAKQVRYSLKEHAK